MRRNSSGILALFAVGGYYLWRNRFQVQEFLEARGLNLPLSTRSLGDAIQSGKAKVAGKAEHLDRSVHHDKSIKQAV